MMNPWRSVPVPGDDPALIEFDFSDDYESSTLEHAREQPQHSAMITPPRRGFKDRGGFIDRENRLLKGEPALTRSCLGVCRVMYFVRHRPPSLRSRLRVN